MVLEVHGFVFPHRKSILCDSLSIGETLIIVKGVIVRLLGRSYRRIYPSHVARPIKMVWLDGYRRALEKISGNKSINTKLYEYS